MTCLGDSAYDRKLYEYYRLLHYGRTNIISDFKMWIFYELCFFQRTSCIIHLHNDKVDFVINNWILVAPVHNFFSILVFLRQMYFGCNIKVYKESHCNMTVF
jgi:hypothetical protein